MNFIELLLLFIIIIVVIKFGYEKFTGKDIFAKGEGIDIFEDYDYLKYFF